MEGQIDGRQPDRDPDRLGEALEEDAAQQRDQHQRDADLVAVQEPGDQRVLQDMGGGVGGREGNRDDEVGGHPPRVLVPLGGPGVRARQLVRPSAEAFQEPAAEVGQQRWAPGVTGCCGQRSPLPAKGSLTTASYSQPECRKARYSPRQMATIPTSTSG
jgi:hypothetical protein